MSARLHPRARRKGLVVTRAGDETLIYDIRRARAYCLEGRLAWLWRRCDGRTGIARLGRALQRRFPEASESVDERLVGGALARLARARLLERPESVPRPRPPGRRAFLRQAAAVGGFGLASLAAPTAAQAATCVTASACFSTFGGGCGGNAGLPCCNTTLTCQRPGQGNGRCQCR